MKSLAFVLILLLHYGQAIDPLLRKGLIDKGSTDKCFCQLEGKVDDCMCDVDTVDYFNNMKIFPRLQSLLQKDYFRYFKYNAHRPCPFWNASQILHGKRLSFLSTWSPRPLERKLPRTCSFSR